MNLVPPSLPATSRLPEDPEKGEWQTEVSTGGPAEMHPASASRGPRTWAQSALGKLEEQLALLPSVAFNVAFQTECIPPLPALLFRDVESLLSGDSWQTLTHGLTHASG